jgi:hypothetical protein
MTRMPVIGTPEHPRLVLYHHGKLVGFNNAIYLFPETDTAVLLLSNAVAINDGPDWIGHLIIQTLFNYTIKHDYVALARETYDRIENELKAELADKTVSPPKSLQAYVAKYFNEAKKFFMDISLKGDGL